MPNCIFGSFKLFPTSKIDFWPFLKLQKFFVFQLIVPAAIFAHSHEEFWTRQALRELKIPLIGIFKQAQKHDGTSDIIFYSCWLDLPQTYQCHEFLPRWIFIMTFLKEKFRQNNDSTSTDFCQEKKSTAFGGGEKKYLSKRNWYILPKNS